MMESAQTSASAPDLSSLRIAFCGAGGTGKTTTARALSEAYNLTFLPSVARSVFERWGLKAERDQLNMTREQNFKLQDDIFAAKESLNREYYEMRCGYVSDRTLLDQVAYFLLRCHSIIDYPTLRGYLERATHDLMRHHVIIYFPLHSFDDDADDSAKRDSAKRDMRDSIFGSRVVFDSVLQNLINITGREIQKVEFVDEPMAVFVCPVDTVENRVKLVVDRALSIFSIKKMAEMVSNKPSGLNEGNKPTDGKYN